MSFTGSITDSRIRLLPSKHLMEFVRDHIDTISELPQNISRALNHYGYDVKNKVEVLTSNSQKSTIDLKLLRDICDMSQEHCDGNITARTAATSCKMESDKPKPQTFDKNTAKSCKPGVYLYLADLHWLNSFLSQLRKEHGLECYLHKFLEDGCELILPENEVVARNPVLEERCEKLRNEQRNQEYRRMTKNVDAVLKNYPEDTIAYQIKAINSQIIAVLQFAFSVLAGFVFGFLGVQLIIGNLDFGFRLLLGIICALIIALAEIYFLAKKLNEIDDAVASPLNVPPAPRKDRKLHQD